jgi:hypothetical protein
MDPLKKVSFLQNMWEVLFENNIKVFFLDLLFSVAFSPIISNCCIANPPKNTRKATQASACCIVCEYFSLNVANMGGFLPDSSRVAIIRRFKVVYIGFCTFKGVHCAIFRKLSSF